MKYNQTILLLSLSVAHFKSHTKTYRCVFNTYLLRKFTPIFEKKLLQLYLTG